MDDPVLKTPSVFKRFRNYISSASYSRTIGIIGLLIIIAAIPLTVFISQKQQEIRQRASGTTETCGVTYSTLIGCQGCATRATSTANNITGFCKPAGGTKYTCCTKEMVPGGGTTGAPSNQEAPLSCSGTSSVQGKDGEAPTTLTFKCDGVCTTGWLAAFNSDATVCKAKGETCCYAKTGTTSTDPGGDATTNEDPANTCSKTFSDVTSGNKYYQAVNDLSKCCVVKGYKDGTFKPDQNITRAQATAFAARYHVTILKDWTLLNPFTPSFSDVPNDTNHPWYKEIETAKSKKFVSGYPDGTFKPFDEWLAGFVVSGTASNNNTKITRGDFVDKLYDTLTTAQIAACTGGIGGPEENTCTGTENGYEYQCANDYQTCAEDLPEWSKYTGGKTCSSGGECCRKAVTTTTTTIPVTTTSTTRPTTTTIPVTTTSTIPPASGDTILTFDIGLDGIGSVGDNLNPDAKDSTKNPLHPARKLFVSVFDRTNQTKINKKETQLAYASTTGRLTGSVNLGTFASDDYTVKIKSEGFLRRLIPGIQSLKPGSNAMTQVNLVNGDINNDNAINILDYNIFISCSSFTSVTSRDPALCDSNANFKTLSDLYDDGTVDKFDYNLFLREYSVQNGD